MLAYVGTCLPSTPETTVDARVLHKVCEYKHYRKLFRQQSQGARLFDARVVHALGITCKGGVVEAACDGRKQGHPHHFVPLVVVPHALCLVAEAVAASTAIIALAFLVLTLANACASAPHLQARGTNPGVACVHLEDLWRGVQKFAAPQMHTWLLGPPVSPAPGHHLNRYMRALSPPPPKVASWPGYM